MPEPFPKHEAIESLLEKTKNLFDKAFKMRLDAKESKKFVFEYLEALALEKKIFGAGYERFILEHPHNEDRLLGVVYAIDELPKDEEKRIFYSQKLMKQMFPHNFPATFLVSRGDIKQGIPPHDIRERIEEDPDTKIKYPLSEVKEALYVIGVYNELDLHMKKGKTTRENVVIGSDGGEYYVDSVANPLHDYLDVRLEKINDTRLAIYLRAKQYSEKDKKAIFSTLKNLRRVVAQQKENKKNS